MTCSKLYSKQVELAIWLWNLYSLSHNFYSRALSANILALSYLPLPERVDLSGSGLSSSGEEVMAIRLDQSS